MDLGFIASNSVDVNIADDEEPYGTVRVVDSDDDRPVAPLNHYWKLRVSLEFKFLGKSLKTVGNLIPYRIS